VIKKSNKNDLYIRNIILLFFTLIPSIIFRPNQDLLERYRFISPDGLDWIVEGRIIGLDDVILPVLRNIGYVLVSKLDWLLGGNGLAFAVTNMSGLFLQGLSLILILNHYQIKHKFQSIGLVIYFGSWIHFSSLYILPDSIAVGCLIFGTTLLAIYRLGNIGKTISGLIVITIGSLFQFYAFAGFIFSILLVVNKKLPKQIIFIKITATFVLAILSLIVTLNWRQSIPHDVVPEPFKLLSINFNMLHFYIEVWILAFALIVLLLIGFANKSQAGTAMKSDLIRYFSFFGISFLFMALFYQWPDSRISYTGTAFSLICLITIFLKSIEFEINSNTSLFEKRQLRSVTIVVVLFSLVMPPNDYWTPKVFENRPLHTWSLIGIREYLRQTPSNYKDISLELKNSCKKQVVDLVSTKDLLLLNFSPYEKNILNSYAKFVRCNTEGKLK
jgi:hypothetical protein